MLSPAFFGICTLCRPKFNQVFTWFDVSGAPLSNQRKRGSLDMVAAIMIKVLNNAPHTDQTSQTHTTATIWNVKLCLTWKSQNNYPDEIP
jgi:hypothetical protein